MRALPRSAQAYLYFVYFLGAITVWLSITLPEPQTHARPWELILFILLAVLASGKKISLNYYKDSSDISLSIGFAVTFAAMLRFGPAGAVLVGAAGSLMLCLFPKRQPPFQLLFNVSLSAVEGWLAGNVFFYVNGSTLYLSPMPTFFAVFASSIVFYCINSCGISIILSLCLKQRLLSVWRSNFLWMAPSYLAGACVSTLAMLLGGQNTGVTLLFIAPVAYLTYQTYSNFSESYAEKQKHIEELQKNQAALTDLYLATIKSLALAIDAKDQYTHQHILRVQRYAMAIAKKMGLDGRELEGLNTGALLHDIGKLGIPEYILLKPGRLTSDEFHKIQKHPEIGAAILDPVDFPWPVLPVVKYHHEKWDGTGYPSGLIGEDIPLTARILAVADVYDALTSTRPYRKAWTHEQAIAQIKKDRGTHFDPAIAEVFLSVIDAVVAEMAADPNEWHVTQSDPRVPVTPRSNQAARAIHEASSELWALYEVAQTLSSSLGLQETLDILVRKLEVILPGTSCLLLLKEEDHEEMTVKAAIGINREFFLGAYTIPHLGHSQQVVEQQLTYSGEYDPGDLIIVASPDSEWVPLESAMIVPIIHQGVVLGTMNLYYPSAKGLTEHDQHLLEMIAQRVAMAIKNARLFDRACTQALTDPLTGLFNLRRLTSSVDERCQRHQSSKTDGPPLSEGTIEPFALLCLDLDSFKPINDNFGHHKGDEVLQDLAQLFRSSVRDEDLVARYGGDEFLIILEGAGPEEAALMAGRIQSAVTNYDPGLQHETLGALRLGVSIGWGCFPQDGQDCATLLSEADSKMYRNKTDRKLGRLADRTRRGGEESSLSLAA